jgi:sulfane dehydrogenase subunit SoxC
VEVSTDGGKKWNRAQLKNTPERMAHVRFGYEWRWDGTETEILSRCTDEIGQRQAMREEIANWWNVPFERNYRVPGLDNSIMPWKIARDGSVTNGLA